ncbi:signal peptidase I [Breznakiella homolactica]|uniref:Signal peptidase I n=1 Tax=Breznakiella homolactica TaxID=2798577 RepID=A0A7T7XKE1_9SPIR|nr:signal peptidase I [Breznakiella homolactica]QQO07976.1 signal peptidase I [Breznakiella homolactica]
MFNKWRKYSYAAQKQQRHKLLWVFLWIVLVFIVFSFLSNFIFSMRVLENETMRPGLHSGDRFIVSSYGFHRLFPDIRDRSPVKRGAIVIIDASLQQDQGILYKTGDTLVRFFTAQRAGLGQSNRDENSFVKRVIGLPGDEISMENFVLRVKPAGDVYGLTEFEVAQKPYDLFIPQVPSLWDVSLPFSGTMEPMLLGVNEYFVLSDDRSNTNDSRTWGPIPFEVFSGRVLFRYWPFSRLGPP